MRYVICYDVAEDHRRTRIADLLKDYGRRVQYSVFVADLDDALAGDLLDKLRRTVDADTDKVHLFLQCQACSGKTQTAGIAETPKDEPYYII